MIWMENFVLLPINEDTVLSGGNYQGIIFWNTHLNKSRGNIPAEGSHALAISSDNKLLVIGEDTGLVTMESG